MTEEVGPENVADFESKANTESNIDSSEINNVDLIENCSDSIGECETSLGESVTPQVENQDMTEKTSEGDSNDQTNSSKSKELKLLLALSKEANLETNIAHKRRNIIKKKELLKYYSPDGKRLSKGSQDNRPMKFPVTAEDELEQGTDQSEVKPSNSNSITNKSLKRTRDSSQETHPEGTSEDSATKSKKIFSADMKLKVIKDRFCWRCHREGVNISCETCPRSYHQKCLKQTLTDTEHWPCPECVAILKAESTHTRSEALKGMTLEHLCSLLKFAVTRMIQCQGSEPFLHPVSDKEFPEYKKYIVQPMDLTKLEKNIKNNLYGSTQAFEADAKWILHNSIIFNSTSSKLTYAAKSIVKICKEEMSEIENCPNCYLNANTKKLSWFVEVCPKPHLLVWAKLKGFPYWPAKIMSTNAAGMVDVRFFGAHDRAWIHHKECFLYSEKDPNTFKQKRYDIEQCIEELNIYVDNLKNNFGDFRHAPYRTFVDPSNELKQLQIFLPKYKGPKPFSYVNKKQSRVSLDKAVDNKSDSKEEKTNDQKLPEMKTDNEDTSNITDKDNDKKQLEQNKAEETSSVPEELSPKPQLQATDHEDSRSNAQSPVNDKDDDKSLMEGYGTDDDSVSEINLERRRALVNKDASMNEDESNEEMEDEDDENDTQVPNNISVDKNLLKGTIKTKSSSHPTPSKPKTPPRRKSDIEGAAKRLSTEVRESPEKKSRRNSDQSVKSDSSRLSNISDKINRVEFSEHMEITLGNDDGCVSISENISPPNGESSKSGSESSFEHKRKPVQVDIDNAEFTISPSNKIKISEKLIKRLTTSKSDHDSKAEEVKKSLVEKPKSPPLAKSQTDILIEKFKDIVEHVVVNFNESSDKTLESKNINADKASTDASKTNTTYSDPTHEPELTPSNEIIGVISTSTSMNNDSDAEKEDAHKPKHNIIQPEELNEEEATKNQEVVEPESHNTEEVSKLTSATDSKKETNLNKPKLMIQPAITKYTTPYLKKNENVCDKNESASADKQEQQQLVNGVKSRNAEVVDIVDEFDEEIEMNKIDELQLDKNRIFNIIHSSLNEARKQSNKVESMEPNRELTSNQEDKPPAKKIKVPVKEFQTYSNQRKLKQLTQEKSELQDKSKVAPNLNLEINETPKIFNKKPPEEADTSTSNVGQKRKMSFDEISAPQPKLVKIVSIEKILNKDLENNELINGSTNSTTQETQQKQQSNSSENFVQEITAEDIKSEIESDDDFNETENLDAKRRYLSALNISERTDDSREKENEIRTRAKAEEKRERFRIIDNLTKVIDDVALNYSAQHEGERLPTRKNSERRKSCGNVPEGEIFVKSFAKMQDNGIQQRARKTFPIPSYIKSISKVIGTKKDIPSIKDVVRTSSSSSQTSSPKVSIIGTKITSTLNVNSSSAIAVSSTNTSTSSTPTILNKALETPLTALSHVILFPGSTINYGSPIMNQMVNGVSTIPSIPTTPLATSQSSVPQPNRSILKLPSNMLHEPPNISSSQNYIPQQDKQNQQSVDGLLPSTAPNGNIILNHLLEQPSSNHTREIMEPSGSSQPVASTSTAEATSSGEIAQDDEFAVLNGLVPESVTRAVSDLLLRPPPRLKPRPPGALSTNFDDGMPSSAGDVTSKINSISHRLGDYFRGMLIETLEDLGKSANPEAKILTLQLELEAVKYRHNLELSEIRKNICTILKDIQKSIMEERERIIDETRTACEIETIKRIELAKSKQWCANCSKEAQFYCCWNTSYCDYPCQQKHWPQHMGKCTQNIEKSSSNSGSSRPGNPVILRQSAPPKPGLGPRIMPKPTKVYMNKAAPAQKTFKAVTSTGNQITVIETTPGNYELLSNGSVVTGKIFTASSNIFNSKFKAGMAPSTSKTSENRIPRLSNSDSNSCSNPAVGMPVQAILEDDS